MKMEKNDKEFNDLERKLRDVKLAIYSGKFGLWSGVCLGIIGAGVSLLKDYLDNNGHITIKNFWSGVFLGGVLAIPSIAGLFNYLSGKYQQNRIKKEYYEENTLFPDYFLN